MKKGKIFSVLLLAATMVNTMTVFAGNETTPDPTRVMGPCITEAGTDITTCDNAASVGLAGSVTPAADNLRWTSSGTGSFVDDADGSTQYLPSGLDRSSGSVTLTITNQQNDGCGGGTTTDEVIITFTAGGPTIDASVDNDILCENDAINDGFIFSATPTNASGVQWSGGLGDYLPNNTATNMSYIPTSTEISANFISIDVRTTGNGSCPSSGKNFTIQVSRIPVSTPGSDHTMCASVGTYELTGGAVDAASTLWITGGTGSFGEETSLTTNYIFSASEMISGGDVPLTLRVYGNTPCSYVEASIILHLMPSPMLDISETSPLYICKKTAESGISLSAMTTAVDVNWMTSSGNINGPSIVYTPTASEFGDGSAYISVTATDPCGSPSDDLYIYFDPSPVVDPMTPITSTCGTAPIDISTTVNMVAVVNWTSSGGTGTFEDQSSPSTKYTPSEDDLTNGSVTLMLEGVGMGSCGFVSEYANVVVTLSGTANEVTVPDNFTHCFSNNTVEVTASSSTGSGHWGGASGGGFFEDVNSFTTIYHFDGAQLTEGMPCVLSFTSDNNGSCPADSKEFEIFVVEPVNWGGINDESVCTSQSTITIDPYPEGKGEGTITPSWAVTSGAGILVEDNEGYGMTYTFDPADVTAGSVTLTFTADDGACPAQDYPAVITLLTSGLTVIAGPDMEICKTDIGTPIQLAGSVTPFAPSEWIVTSGVVGSFAEYTDPATTYQAGATTEVAILTLRAYDEGVGCEVTSSMKITVGKPLSFKYPSSSDYNICAGDVFNLEATNAVDVTWGTVGGTGTFLPDEHSTAAQYQPGNGETSVTFTIKATAEAGCLDEDMTLPYAVSIFPLPLPVAGTDQTVCDPSVITMTATAPGANATGKWTAADQLTDASITNPNDPATTITAGDGYDGPADFIWTVRETHKIKNETGFCEASDAVTITYISSIDVEKDTILSAPAGDVVTLDVAQNDFYRGFTPTFSIENEHVNYSANTATISNTGILSFTNFAKEINVEEKVVYKVTVCTVTDQDTVTITLINGAPFVPITAVTDTLVQKLPEVPVSITVDFAKKLKDYNDNIDWSKYEFVSSLSGVTPDASSNDGKIIFPYTSGRSEAFTGIDVIKFYIEDQLGERVLVTYEVEILPDYSNPSVKPEDFVVINALSPNGDNVNDYLYVHGLSEYHNTVVIYNRWSEKVWEAENYDNLKVRFEGIGNQKTADGVLPEGTYFYVIKNEGKDENGEKTGLYSGYIEIRR